MNLVAVAVGFVVVEFFDFVEERIGRLLARIGRRLDDEPTIDSNVDNGIGAEADEAVAMAVDDVDVLVGEAEIIENALTTN
jgi:hypothetical protein